jgi:hypothetical protein
MVRPEGVIDINVNRTRDLPSRSAVPQPTSPPRTPVAGNGVKFNLPVCMWQMAGQTHLKRLVHLPRVE